MPRRNTAPANRAAELVAASCVKKILTNNQGQVELGNGPPFRPPALRLDNSRPNRDLVVMIASISTRTVLLLGEVLGVALVVWLVWAFNRLVRSRNLMLEGWSGIDEWACSGCERACEARDDALWHEPRRLTRCGVLVWCIG